jgi:DNA mismatch repair ATPase MutS
VECGYNFRFFGEDADVAQGLSLILFDDNFKTASIPNLCLTHLVGRLVQAGDKVGLVRQIERVTLKDVSDKASGLFARQPCEVCIRGLVVADGQLGGITVFPESINAVSSASNIASSFETTSSAYKPAFAFVTVDKPPKMLSLIHSR